MKGKVFIYAFCILFLLAEKAWSGATISGIAFTQGGNAFSHQELRAYVRSELWFLGIPDQKGMSMSQEKVIKELEGEMLPEELAVALERL